MTDKDVETRELTAKELRNQTSEALNRVAFGGAQVAITRHGKVVAYLVSEKDVEELRRLRAERVSPEFRAAADAVRERYEKLLERLADR